MRSLHAALIKLIFYAAIVATIVCQNLMALRPEH